MRLFVYNDESGWGLLLYTLACQRGWNAKLFKRDDPLEGESGYIFIHMHNSPGRRRKDKDLVARFAARPEFVVIPDAASARLYDDKLRQAKVFKRWMPETRVFENYDDAMAHAKTAQYPFISKTSIGSGSRNVRLIKTAREAAGEAHNVFHKGGIKGQYGLRQKDYLIWQKFCPGNDNDFRILFIGKTGRLMMRRGNRPDRPMASGSGLTLPIVLPEEEALSALAFGEQIAVEHNLTWAGIDLVRDGEGGPWRLLETTVGWTLPAYYGCRFLPAGRNGAFIFDVLMDEILAGSFGEPQCCP